MNSSIICGRFAVACNVATSFSGYSEVLFRYVARTTGSEKLRNGLRRKRTIGLPGIFPRYMLGPNSQNNGGDCNEQSLYPSQILGQSRRSRLDCAWLLTLQPGYVACSALYPSPTGKH